MKPSVVKFSLVTLCVFGPMLARAQGVPRPGESPGLDGASTATGLAALHLDAEIDPAAYILNGHSLHVGLGYNHWRLDLGNFAIEVPGFLDREGFDTTVYGFGLKLQHFFDADPLGPPTRAVLASLMVR